MDQQPAKPVRDHHCAFCGAVICRYDARFCEPDDTCGAVACERWARENALAEREEAHERLDRDMGW